MEADAPSYEVNGARGSNRRVVVSAALRPSPRQVSPDGGFAGVFAGLDRIRTIPRWTLNDPVVEADTGEPMREKPANLYCTFCGKSPDEVRKLITGPSVAICDECIWKCNDILAKETSKPVVEARSHSEEEERPKGTVALRCSFCGSGQQEVGKLIAGPTVYICDECIGLCNDIIAEDIDWTQTGPAPLATLPRDALAVIAGILKRGLPAAARIHAVLHKQATEDSVNRMEKGEARDERLWGPWHLAGDWKFLHERVERQASEESESHEGGNSGSGAAIIERLSGTLEVLDVLAGRVEGPVPEELRPSLKLAREKLREARELLLASRPMSPTD